MRGRDDTVVFRMLSDRVSLLEDYPLRWIRRVPLWSGCLEYDGQTLKFTGRQMFSTEQILVNMPQIQEVSKVRFSFRIRFLLTFGICLIVILFSGAVVLGYKTLMNPVVLQVVAASSVTLAAVVSVATHWIDVWVKVTFRDQKGDLGEVYLYDWFGIWGGGGTWLYKVLEKVRCEQLRRNGGRNWTLLARAITGVLGGCWAIAAGIFYSWRAAHGKAQFANNGREALFWVFTVLMVLIGVWVIMGSIKSLRRSNGGKQRR